MELKGRFSRNFFSLQLQLKTLMEEAGGDQVVGFLDTLCDLTASEQKVMLKIMTRVLERIAKGDQRLALDADRESAEFEENLVRDILAALRDAAKEPTRLGKLEVLPGGKARLPNTPLDFEKARRAKVAGLKPVVN